MDKLADRTNAEVRPGRRTIVHNSVWCAALVLATVIAYSPALRGGMFFDDDLHVTAPSLRSWNGLARIWLEPGATQQYYPLLHTAFWVEYRLWGDWLPGYHATNVLLHVLSACLLWALLGKLSVKGSWLASAIFALHPVAVESVAWISQQKNTLSMVLYLSAALAFLRFVERRTPGRYAVATVLFAGALLAKTATVTLPAALLLVLWWRRGRLAWQGEIRPLIPWFCLSLAAGLVTTQVERMLLGTEGETWSLELPDRAVLASRAVWFYLGKLLWPKDLVFVYPQWDLGSGGAARYLWIVATASVLVALWLMRRRSRAPLAVGLLYVGSLAPTLGFIGLYYYKYSYVADHFQYLAMPSVIAVFAASLLRLSSTRARGIVPAAVVLLVTVLGTLTYLQAGTYRDAETLYRTTARRNPACWMALNNLGVVLIEAGRPAEAIDPLEKGTTLKPDSYEPRMNLARALTACGRGNEAEEQYREALRIMPGSAVARNNLANQLRSRGRAEEAIELLRQALRLDPSLAEAEASLGAALSHLGRWREAIPHFEAALWKDPKLVEAEFNLAVALARAGRREEAVACLERVLRTRPSFAGAAAYLGNLLIAMGRTSEAIPRLEQAVRLEPESAEVAATLAIALAQVGRGAEAVSSLERIARMRPNDASALFNLGNVLSELGRAAEGEPYLRRAVELQPDSPVMHHALAVALFRVGAGRPAVEEFRIASSLDPRNPEYLCDLAAALAATSRNREAVAALQEALRQRPGHSRASALMNLIGNRTPQN